MKRRIENALRDLSSIEIEIQDSADCIERIKDLISRIDPENPHKGLLVNMNKACAMLDSVETMIYQVSKEISSVCGMLEYFAKKAPNDPA